MATAYGNTTNHWRAYLDYTVSQTDTAVTVTVNGAGFQSVGWGFQLSSGVSCTATLTGQAAKSGSGGFSSGTGQTVSKSLVSGSWTVARGTSAQTLALAVSVTNSSGYMNGTSSLAVNVSVPALDSWQVTYNANGGSGAPSAQTKWRGRALALSGVKPTRAGYTFRGWATSASGAVAYQPGASYTGNAALALYAVWSLDYLAPTVSGLTAERCTSAGAAADGGTYARVRCSYAARQSGNKITNVKVEYKLSTSSSWTQAYSANPSAASGSLNVVTCGGKLSADSVYDIRVTVSDAGGSSSATTQVAGQFYPLDIGDQGRSWAFGKAATQEGFEVAMDARFEGTLTNKGRDVAVLGYAVVGNNGTFDGSTGYWRRVARCEIRTTFTDRVLKLLVTAGYGNGQTTVYGNKGGILVAHARTGASATAVQTAALYWELAGQGVSGGDFVLCHRVSGGYMEAELWCRNTNEYQLPTFTVLTDGDRFGVHPAGWGWTLYSDTEDGAGSASPPSGWTQVASTVMHGGAPVLASGSWRYVQYPDGTFEAWGRFSQTPQITGAMDGGYYAQVSYSLPFTAVDVYGVQATAEVGRAVWATVSYVDLSTVRVFLCSGAQVTGVNVLCDVYVFGRWR